MQVSHVPVIPYHKAKRLHRLSIPSLKILTHRYPKPEASGRMASHEHMGKPGGMIKLCFALDTPPPHLTELSKETPRGASATLLMKLRQKEMDGDI